MPSWFLAYGGYSFEPRMCHFVIEKQTEHARTGLRIAYTEKWHVKGRVTGTTEAQISTKIKALETALIPDMNNLAFFGENGVTAHFLDSQSSTNGVEILGLKWLNANEGQKGSGAEYVFRRSFEFTAKARYLDQSAVEMGQDAIIFYHETLQGIGDGGPKWRLVPSLRGPVQLQVVQAYTAYTGRQTDIRIGLNGTPNPVGPFYPGMEHTDVRQITYETANRIGRQISTDWPTTNSYTFESASRVV